MKTALLLIALLPTCAHAVNKCVVAGKVLYTDAPCERLGGQTTKTFIPQANVVESQETADVKRKIASGEMTVTQTLTDGNGVRETRALPLGEPGNVQTDRKRSGNECRCRETTELRPAPRSACRRAPKPA